MSDAPREAPGAAGIAMPLRVAGLLLGALAAMLPAACDVLEQPVAPSPTPVESGLRGSVVIVVDCPDPAAEPPCVEPYPARLVILDADSEKVTEISTDETGSFSIALVPGSYTIAPVPGGEPYPTAPLLPVSVVEGAWTDVTVRYDSGTL